MASNVEILINGYDYTPLIPYESVKVDNNVVMTSDTMTFRVVLLDGDTVMKSSISYPATRPRCGNEVIWQNPNNMKIAPDGSNKPFREFGGVIVEVKEDVEGASLVYEVSCKSYVHWLDRHLVTAWYNQQAPETTVRDIVTRFAKGGFTSYNVKNTGVTVVPQYFEYKKVSEAIKSIADQLEWGWYVDHYKDVHFYAMETFNSPLPNNTLLVDTDVTSYSNLVLSENSQQQVNKVFIKGFKTRSKEKHYLTYSGDGATKQWSLGYRVSSVAGDVQVVVYNSMADYNADTSFKTGGTNSLGTLLTLKRDIIDGAPEQGGAANTAYIHYTQHLVRIPDFAGGGAVPTGKVVAVRFHYLREMVWLAQDPVSQGETAELEGGTDGVYEDVFSDKSLTNSTLDAVKAKGQLILMKYRKPQINGSFESYFDATTTGGWVAGQYFILDSKKRFGGIREVLFVHRVSKSIIKNDIGGLITHYQVEFADSPYLV